MIGHELSTIQLCSTLQCTSSTQILIIMSHAVTTTCHYIIQWWRQSIRLWWKLEHYNQFNFLIFIFRLALIFILIFLYFCVQQYNWNQHIQWYILGNFWHGTCVYKTTYTQIAPTSLLLSIHIIYPTVTTQLCSY